VIMRDLLASASCRWVMIGYKVYGSGQVIQRRKYGLFAQNYNSVRFAELS
jgi:hypothetical protein